MANNTILAPTQTAQTTTDITVASGADVTIELYTDNPSGIIPTAGGLQYWLMQDNPGSVDNQIADLGRCKGYGQRVGGGVYRVIIPAGLATYGVNVGVFTYT